MKTGMSRSDDTALVCKSSKWDFRNMWDSGRRTTRKRFSGNRLCMSSSQRENLAASTSRPTALVHAVVHHPSHPWLWSVLCICNRWLTQLVAVRIWCTISEKMLARYIFYRWKHICEPLPLSDLVLFTHVNSLNNTLWNTPCCKIHNKASDRMVFQTSSALAQAFLTQTNGASGAQLRCGRYPPWENLPP